MDPGARNMRGPIYGIGHLGKVGKQLDAIYEEFVFDTIIFLLQFGIIIIIMYLL